MFGNRKRTVTVLRRENGWGPNDFSKISEAIFEEVAGVPKMPQYLIAPGSRTKDEIAAAIETDDFTLTVTDTDDPNLPFIPPF